ncbi:MAG: hypothetical protein ABJQ23_12220 [Shimia thalassica]|uniref:hypothetical protein n=2 Tax=Shimia thalassica TaxID=1715693 RepID=UPI003298365E
MSFKIICALVAYSAPETPMQRVGAVLMMSNTMLCTAIVAGVIVEAWDKNWTGQGVVTVAFAAVLLASMLPFGVAHTMVVFSSRMLDPWRFEPETQAELIRASLAERMKDMYLVLGWFATIGTVVVLFYAIVFRLF